MFAILLNTEHALAATTFCAPGRSGIRLPLHIAIPKAYSRRKTSYECGSIGDNIYYWSTQKEGSIDKKHSVAKPYTAASGEINIL